MTILGLVALCCCAVMFASGVVGIEVLPQFLVSAVVFLASGQLLRGVGRSRAKNERDGETPPREPNWTLRTQILNWVMAIVIICALGLWVMKPVGVSFIEMFGIK